MQLLLHRNCLTPRNHFRGRFGVLLLALLGAVIPMAGAPAYDFFICANVNRNYVIGSKIVTTNGLFQRDPAANEWKHFGYNDTTISAVAFDPRDRDIIYTTKLNGIWVSYHPPFSPSPIPSTAPSSAPTQKQIPSSRPTKMMVV